jgi:hypothetical protein
LRDMKEAGIGTLQCDISECGTRPPHTAYTVPLGSHSRDRPLSVMGEKKYVRSTIKDTSVSL